MLFVHLKLLVFSALVGVLGGFVGAAFSHTLSIATGIRESAPWLILLLPIAGVTTVLIYRALRMEDHGGTNEIIRNLQNQSKIRIIAAPLIFICTAITHLFGGSAGREGAAIQLGGAGAAAFSRVLKLRGDEKSIFIMSGMSALFAGVFGTPLTAAFFILEFKSSKRIFPSSILPCFISAIIAKFISSLLGIEAETAHIVGDLNFTFSTTWKILVLAILLCLLGFAMCFMFDHTHDLVKRFFKSPILRTIVLSIALIVMTAFVGDMRYNNSGMEMALAAIEGEADWYDFILKTLFTAVTLAAGFKGGKIVPTFCIGATFGCIVGGMLGLDVGLAAAIGLVGLFCCVTNSPFGALCLGIEMFGITALPYFVIVCIILWLLSLNRGLFDGRLLKSPIFTKLKR